MREKVFFLVFLTGGGTVLEGFHLVSSFELLVLVFLDSFFPPTPLPDKLSFPFFLLSGCLGGGGGGGSSSPEPSFSSS